MDTKKIGQRIKYARSLRNYTLEDIASDIGVAKSTIQRYENALITSPKLPVLQAIANSLRVNPSWLSGQDVDMEIETFNQQWDRESDKLFDKINAFEAQLHALGWNCEWSDVDHMYVLSNGIASIKITPEEYGNLQRDFEASCRRHLQKLILNSLNSNSDQELSADQERTCIKVADEMHDHDSALHEKITEVNLLAAHRRTDVEYSEEGMKHDLDIMSDENF